MVWVLPEIDPEARIQVSSRSLLESEGNAGGEQGGGTGRERKPLKGMLSSQLPPVTSAQSCGGYAQKCKKPKPKLNPNKKASELRIRPLVELRSSRIYTPTLRCSLTEDSQGCQWAALGFWDKPQAERSRPWWWKSEAGRLRAKVEQPSISWRLP